MFNVWIIIMQSLNIKEWKLLELPITQTRHPPSILQKKMFKFQKWKNHEMYNKIRGAHLHCMNNHYAFKGKKTVAVTDYTNQTPPTHFRWKKCLSSTPVKLWKYLSNVHKIRGAHFQCMNNHHAKFEYKEMKVIGVTDYTNLTFPMHFWWKKCLSSTNVKNKKIFIKCQLNKRCTFSMY